MVEYYISSTKYTTQERMTRRGKVYDVVFRVITLNGKEKQKKLSGFANKTLAKQGYADFVTSKCELLKNNPIKKKDPIKHDLIVGDLVREYLSTLFNQNKDSSIYDKQNIYRLFIFPRFEKTKMNDLTKEELYRWQDELWTMKNPKTGNFYSYNYLSKIRGHFSSFCSWCNERYSINNPFKGLKKPKRRVPTKKMQIWKREEFDKFISVVDDPMYHALFTLMFFTGRRKGEIFALAPEDIKTNSIIFEKSLTRKTVDGAPYKITSTKTDKVQDIPVCSVVQEELRIYQGESPFFFGGEKPLAEMTVSRTFEKYCKKAGVKTIHIHELRHSFVSMLIHLGANLMVVADLIGDTVEQVIKTYGHLYKSDKQTIIDKIQPYKS